jgi:hypothetical protein
MVSHCFVLHFPKSHNRAINELILKWLQELVSGVPSCRMDRRNCRAFDNFDEGRPYRDPSTWLSCTNELETDANMGRTDP